MEQEQVRRRLPVRTKVAMFLILLLIPITILVGVFILEDRKYYMISLLIIVYTMIPFFMIFEARGPRARELVLLAVMTALGVSGRVAFFMVPQFKPVVAIVIITGVCLGAESGFLVGCLTGFVSNFFFGQGPWTVWQMFCFGIIGFIAGILFERGMLKKERIPLCVYGGLATFFIYGGIINIGSVLMATGNLNLKVLMTYYSSALGFDLIHASATVFFLWILSGSMIEKIERIKIKYGLIQSEE